jgi:hypothetical protein
MSYSNAFDFYAEFDEHAKEFEAATTFQEFCSLVGGKLWERLAKYTWVPSVFATAKAGKRTSRALAFPAASKFSDLFERAVFIPSSNTNGYPHGQPKGFVYLGGAASFCAHLGGKRGYSETQPDVRHHFGCEFYGTYVAPISPLSYVTSFKAIPREDGILIIARQGSIERDWIALLDRDEDITQMFDAETKALLASEKAAAKAAWGDEEL